MHCDNKGVQEETAMAQVSFILKRTALAALTARLA